MTKNRTKKGILIVCEGTNTEPDYFNFLANKFSKPENIWDFVYVFDNKSLPNDISIPEKTELGSRKKRKLKFENPNTRKKTDKNLIEEFFIEKYGESEGIEKYEDIKAMPLRFVAIAQEFEKELNGYEELWTVYDKNGHSSHEEAVKKAKELTNGKIVNIGISNRSFEQWILLHFERTNKDFENTQCGENIKDKKGKKKKIIFECGKNTHLKDCIGQKCLVGNIRVNTLLKNYAKSSNQKEFAEMMKILMNKIEIAFENAAWLRYKMQQELSLNDNKIFEINPYTDVDILVKKLLGFNKEFHWTDFNIKTNFSKVDLTIFRINSKQIRIEFSNRKFLNKNPKYYLKDKSNRSIYE